VVRLKETLSVNVLVKALSVMGMVGMLCSLRRTLPRSQDSNSQQLHKGRCTDILDQYRVPDGKHSARTRWSMMLALVRKIVALQTIVARMYNSQ